MSTPLRQIIDLLEAEFPASWVVKGDHCGWELGQPDSPIDTILIALEATPAVVLEARQRQAQLLLTHHPLLYLPPASLREDEPVAHLVGELIRSGIALVSCHTNLDVAPGGINDYLAQRLGLSGVQVLAPTTSDPYFKLVVFVPPDYEDRVRQVLGDAGLGLISRYAHCSFSARGQGTFVPLEGARPYLGEAGTLNRVEESRLEILAPESRLEEALARLRQVHPYEEVAYDLYPLRHPGTPLGLGRSGFWPEPKDFSGVMGLIKEIFGISTVRLWGQPPDQVERVALCSGSGGDLIGAAQKSRAQLYLTGEVRHHQFPAGEFRDFAVAEVGHFASEVVFMAPWARRLEELFQQAGWSLQVAVAADQAPPYKYL